MSESMPDRDAPDQCAPASPMSEVAKAAGVTRERVRQLVEFADVNSGNCVHTDGSSITDCARCHARRTLREMGYFG